MTNSECVNLFTNLQDKELLSFSGSKFSYALIRNLNILKPLVAAYEESRKALLESFAKKDKEKKPMLETVKVGGIDQQQYVLENPEKFQKEIQNLLLEEVAVNLYKVELSEMPKDITPVKLAGIFDIVKEEPVEQPIKKKK